MSLIKVCPTSMLSSDWSQDYRNQSASPKLPRESFQEAGELASVSFSTHPACCFIHTSCPSRSMWSRLDMTWESREGFLIIYSENFTDHLLCARHWALFKDMKKTQAKLPGLIELKNNKQEYCIRKVLSIMWKMIMVSNRVVGAGLWEKLIFK